MAKKPQRTKGELEKMRDTAEDMFIRLGMTGREIAERLDVTEQTISNWRKGREGVRSWDDRKRDLDLSPTKLRETLQNEAQWIAEGNKPRIQADALSKVMSAIREQSKTINPSVVMAVLQALDNFTAEVDPKKAIDNTELHKQFLFHIISLES